MTSKIKGVFIALFILVTVGITGAVVPQLLTLSRNGVLAAFPVSVMVGSAVAFAMLAGFFIGRYRG